MKSCKAVRLYKVMPKNCNNNEPNKFYNIQKAVIEVDQQSMVRNLAVKSGEKR